MKIRLSIRVAAVAAAITLSVTAACGSTSTDNSAGGSVTQADLTAPNESSCVTQGISTDKEIHLGSWMPRSGPLSNTVSVGEGAQLAFDEINSEGGINGYTIRFDIVDDGADPTRTVGVARSLWNDDKVFALFMPYGSSPNNAAKQFVLDNNILTLFPYASSDIYFPAGQDIPPYVFGWYPPYWALVAQLTEFFANERDVKTVAVLHTQDDYGKAGQEGVKAAAEKFGLEVVEDLGYDASETNYDPLGRKLAGANPDAIFAWAIPGATNIMKAAADAGYDGYWAVQSGLFGENFQTEMRQIPSLKNKTYLSNFQLMRNDDDPNVNDFVVKFLAKHPKSDPDLAIQGWTEALVLAEAIKVATSAESPLTCQTLTDTLNSMRGLTVGAGVDVGYTVSNHFGASKGKVYEWDGTTYMPLTSFSTFPGMEDLTE